MPAKEEHSFLLEGAGRLHGHRAGAAGINAPGRRDKESAGVVSTDIPSCCTLSWQALFSAPNKQF